MISYNMITKYKGHPNSIHYQKKNKKQKRRKQDSNLNLMHFTGQSRRNQHTYEEYLTQLKDKPGTFFVFRILRESNKRLTQTEANNLVPHCLSPQKGFTCKRLI